MIRTCYKNILETGAVSLSVGTEDPAYPLYRLYDRNIGRIFKPASSGSIAIKTDQGASPLAIDRLLIPAGHNLDGMSLDLSHSVNDTDWVSVLSFVQSGSGLIDKPFTSVSKRYWRFYISSPPTLPQITELFLTATYEWERNPTRPGGPFNLLFNVERAESYAGQVRFLIKGDARRQRVYRVVNAGETQKNNILSLNDVWQGGKSFYLYDHEGIWLFGELRREIKLMEVAYQAYNFDFDFLEVLP